MIKRPTTLKGHLLKAVATSLMTTSLFGGALLMAPTEVQGQVDEAPYAQAQESKVDRLFRTHHCWTGDQAPKTKNPFGPTKALVTRNNKTRILPADAGYAIWLEGAPGTLHGFCR